MSRIETFIKDGKKMERHFIDKGTVVEKLSEGKTEKEIETDERKPEVSTAEVFKYECKKCTFVTNDLKELRKHNLKAHKGKNK